MHELELIGVSSGYTGKEVLHNISFKTHEPSIYVVLGPNGAGKTTLFRTIGGILKPSGGQVKFNGQDLFRSKVTRRRINYLSHLNALPEEMTVYDALKFYTDIEGGDVDNALDMLDLKEFRDRKLSSLSQGQKKRVSMGKIFLNERDLYLLDEPTSNLDPKVSKEIRELLLKLSKDKLVLYSSHNLYEAREIGTYLILIKDGALRFFDRVDQLRPKEYRVGFRSPDDVSKVLAEAKYEKGYYVVTVKSPEAIGSLVKDLVEKGITLTEVRELDNPLEELFE